MDDSTPVKIKLTQDNNEYLETTVPSYVVDIIQDIMVNWKILTVCTPACMENYLKLLQSQNNERTS